MTAPVRTEGLVWLLVWLLAAQNLLAAIAAPLVVAAYLVVFAVSGGWLLSRGDIT